MICFWDYYVNRKNILDAVKLKFNILRENSGIGEAGLNKGTEFLQRGYFKCLSTQGR